MKRTRFGVRPDYHTTDEITALAPEKGVIVFNTDLSVNQYWDGANWVSQNPQDAINELVNGAFSRIHRVIVGFLF